MKLQSIPRRRGASEAKKASDVYDIVRLLEAHDGTGTLSRDLLAAAPPELVDFCAEAAMTRLVTEAERTVRWMRVWGVTDDMERRTPEELRTLGRHFVSRLAFTPGSGSR